MTTFKSIAGRTRALAAALSPTLAAGLCMTARPAQAAAYVDDGTPDVKVEDRVKVANPQPVQLLFQFDMKGAPNARATKLLKDKVVEAVKNSGLFSDVIDGPASNGAILNVVIDNVVQPKDLQAAEAQGFATGATLFLAGSNITDHYVCTVDYVAGPTAPKITKTAHHAIITQIGIINSAPAHAVKIGSAIDAAYVMTRQIVTNPLNALAADPGFQAPAAASPPAGSAPSETPPAASAPPSDAAPAPAPAPAPATPSSAPAQPPQVAQ